VFDEKLREKILVKVEKRKLSMRLVTRAGTY